MIFPLLETIGKKKFNYNEKRKKKKKWCRNLEIGYCMICIVRLYCGEQWQRQGAGLGTGARAGALGRAAGAGACGRVLGARAWHGQASGRRAGSAGERQAHGRWRASARADERQLGTGAGGRQGAGRAAGRWARGRALGARQGAGRAAGRWARGRQALGARGARGLGAWADLGQCTRCTRPISDPF